MFILDDIIQGNPGKYRFYENDGPDPNFVFRAAHHDSRQIEAGDLFIAIRGAKVDGHRFIPEVARTGALGALCTQPSDDVPAGFLQIIVPDVVAALQATARVRAQRQKHTTLIGITGSNGKTSTKEAVAMVLSTQAPTLKTQASYNNEIGYPLTLLRLEDQHRYAVLEMGAQHVGELAWLCRSIASPNWSLITNVGAAHLEYFGSQERIVLAKSELVEALAPDGVAILNYDDSNVRGMSAKTRAHVLYYGLSEQADVRGSDVEGDTLFGHRFILHYQHEQRPVQLRLPGAHGVIIALAAAAAGCAAGMSLDLVGIALERLVPAKGRCEIKTGPNGSILVDDTYNANRQSIVAITRAMRQSQRVPEGKRWAVLGDIFELGSFAEEEHRASGRALAENIDCLLAIGNEARFYVEGAVEAGMPEQQAMYLQADVENATELDEAKRSAAHILKQQVQQNDLVLLKGSRGMRMETILDLL